MTILQEFWQRFGWTEDDLEHKPRRQIDDYLEFMKLQEHNQKIEAKRRSGKG